MEDLVEAKYEEYKDQLEGCKCEQCRNDVICLALNRLTPRYVVSTKGYLFSKLQSLEPQYSVDVIKAISEASQIVGSRPNHEKTD